MATNQLLSAIIAAGSQSQTAGTSPQMSPVNHHNFGSANSLGPLPIQSLVGGNGGGGNQ